MPRTRLLTPPDRLNDAAVRLRRQADRLEAVRADLARRMSVAAFAGSWEGRAAERFLVHVDGSHRQAHLTEAHGRLCALAEACRRAAGANAARIDRHRVLRDQVVDALVARKDFASIGHLPSSVRDTRWPAVHAQVVGRGCTWAGAGVAA